MSDPMNDNEIYIPSLLKTLSIKYVMKSDMGSQTWERKSDLSMSQNKSEAEVVPMAITMVDFVIAYGASMDQAENIFSKAISILKKYHEEHESMGQPTEEVVHSVFPKKGSLDVETRIQQEVNNSENVNMFLGQLQSNPDFLKEVFTLYMRSVFE